VVGSTVAGLCLILDEAIANARPEPNAKTGNVSDLQLDGMIASAIFIA